VISCPFYILSAFCVVIKFICMITTLSNEVIFPHFIASMHEHISIGFALTMLLTRIMHIEMFPCYTPFQLFRSVISLWQEVPLTLKTGTRDRPDHDRNAITDNVSFLPLTINICELRRNMYSYCLFNTLASEYCYNIRCL